MNKFNIGDLVVLQNTGVKGEIFGIEKKPGSNLGEFNIFYYLENILGCIREYALELVNRWRNEDSAILEPFTPEEHNFIGEIKRQITSFLDDCVAFKILDEDTKLKINKHLGDNWYDERFDGKPFINASVLLAMTKWQDQNFNLAKLWCDIVVNNSKSNNEPQLVANEAVK